MKYVIGIIAGSLRKDSYSKKIAKAIVEMMPEGYVGKIISIDNLPIYNQDFDDEGNTPETYRDFREEIKNVNGVIFITPEYNRSIPAVLKNAIDVGSRPYGESVWNAKPAAVFSSSPGNLGAYGANHHLRQILVVLNMPTLAQPEVYLSNIVSAFDEKGNWVNESTKDFLQKAVNAYIEWFNKNV